MKFIGEALIIACLLLTTACNQKTEDDHHDSHDMTESSPNQALYDQVMAVHDEVMPKMNDLHKAKTALQTRLELPGVPQNERDEIKLDIARIDSASDGMMVWMRQFDPLPDSVGSDSARAYLERELQKVKKVREDILTTLEAVN